MSFVIWPINMIQWKKKKNAFFGFKLAGCENKMFAYEFGQYWIMHIICCISAVNTKRKYAIHLYAWCMSRHLIVTAYFYHIEIIRISLLLFPFVLFINWISLNNRLQNHMFGSFRLLFALSIYPSLSQCYNIPCIMHTHVIFISTYTQINACSYVHSL